MELESGAGNWRRYVAFVDSSGMGKSMSMNHSLTLRLVLCLCVSLAPSFYTLGQNNNASSSNRTTKRATRRKAIKKKSSTEPDISGIDLSEFDFSGVDALIREEKEWPHIGNTSYSSVSYGVKTIKRLNGGIIRVWTKMTLKDETTQTKSEFLRIRENQGLSTNGYKNFSHTFELDEYNCVKGESRVLSQVDYDEEGNVISSVSYRNPRWDYIVPDSIGESIFQTICKQRK
jgi:hypothetical protein